MSKKKMNYHELAKNDPNFHDVRARILLEAAHQIRVAAVNQPFHIEKGMWEAASELKRMASNARRAHNKHQDQLRDQRRASEAKAKAFGH